MKPDSLYKKRVNLLLASAFLLGIGIYGCGGDTDAGSCLVTFYFERAESTTTTSSRTGGTKLIYRGKLDDRCVDFIEKSAGGFSYVIRGKSEAVASGQLNTPNETLSTVDFGGGRIDKFSTTANTFNSQGQGASSFVNGNLELTVSHLDDSPTSTTSTGTSTGTSTTTSSSSTSSVTNSSAGRMDLPWTDGVRIFEVTFLSTLTTQVNAGDSQKPSGVTILLNLPDKS